jgi:hypothetical protein
MRAVCAGVHTAGAAARERALTAGRTRLGEVDKGGVHAEACDGVTGAQFPYATGKH